MRLMRYNVVAEHIPAKDLKVPDTLSRMPLSSMEFYMTEEVEEYVNLVETNLAEMEDKKTDLRKATMEDSVLQSAIMFTLTGWPRHESDVPESLKSLYAHRATLSVSDGLLVFGSRYVIPATMRPAILDKIHDGHLGVTKCLERSPVGRLVARDHKRRETNSKHVQPLCRAQTYSEEGTITFNCAASRSMAESRC